MAFRNEVTRISQLIADFFSTAEAPDRRIEISSAFANMIQFFTGYPGEENPGHILGDSLEFGVDQVYLDLRSPSLMVALNEIFAQIHMQAEITGDSQIKADADDIILNGDVSITGHLTATGTGWTAITLVAGWANVGFGWPSAQYKRVGDILYTRGLIQRTGAGVPANAAINVALPASAWTSGVELLSTNVFSGAAVSVAGQRLDYGNGAGGVITSVAAIATGQYAALNGAIHL